MSRDKTLRARFWSFMVFRVPKGQWLYWHWGYRMVTGKRRQERHDEHR